MKIGEKAELLMQSSYGYGDSGSPPKIPGGAALLFEVELISVDASTGTPT
jgi:FKBP-type peptidyl-prolyl cis-trans isomerase